MRGGFSQMEPTPKTKFCWPGTCSSGLPFGERASVAHSERGREIPDTEPRTVIRLPVDRLLVRGASGQTTLLSRSGPDGPVVESGQQSN